LGKRVPEGLDLPKGGLCNFRCAERGSLASPTTTLPLPFASAKLYAIIYIMPVRSRPAGRQPGTRVSFSFRQTKCGLFNHNYPLLAPAPPSLRLARTAGALFLVLGCRRWAGGAMQVRLLMVLANLRSCMSDLCGGSGIVCRVFFFNGMVVSPLVYPFPYEWTKDQ
jgi:hypothetical protein